MKNDLLRVRASIAMWACLVNTNIAFLHESRTVFVWGVLTIFVWAFVRFVLDDD